MNFYNNCISLHYAYSFHNKLKTNPRYLAHQVNCRIDTVLLKMEEDMFHDRMSKEVLKEPWDASLQREGSERHICYQPQ